MKITYTVEHNKDGVFTSAKIDNKRYIHPIYGAFSPSLPTGYAEPTNELKAEAFRALAYECLVRASYYTFAPLTIEEQVELMLEKFDSNVLKGA